MMKLKFVLFSLFTILLSFLQAQSFNHPLTLLPGTKAGGISDTVRILAVMVEFRTDDDGNTVGDGTFGSIYSQNYGSTILDPLPHDKDYFSAHLDFAKDYFQKSSNGKVTIAYKVLDDVVRLSKTMLDYSPDVNSNDISPLGGFAQDVWRAVDNLNVVDFSKYDLFLIFHAGVGRDVTLPGSLGLERDLPSVFLNLNSLKNIFGSLFDGFRVNNGNFKITNSAVLPETESREVSGLGGSSLVQLSINGLIVSMIGSYLGLPDLYDTQTGKTAIGRFGLMDGQSIFAYGGTFPPMPSAWEKVYLGWVKPVVVNKDSVGIVVNSAPNETIYKVPINETEYYLVENRERDGNNDGANLNLWRFGRTEKKKFSTDSEGFQSYDVSALYGVVTSVDEYDWALPGSGILIWHIDQKVIDQNIASNRINANPERRGVDLEEADGIQDIGVDFQTIFGDVVIGEGEANDFWFKGNSARLYQNRFASDTKPNTNSNDGSESLISFSDFSEKGNSMTFNLSFSADNVRKVVQRDFTFSNDFNYLVASDSNKIFTLDGNDLVEYDLTNDRVENKGEFAERQPALLNIDGKKFLFGTVGKKLNIFSLDSNKVLETYYNNVNFSSVPVVVRRNGKDKILIGDGEGKILTLGFSETSSALLTKEKEETLFDAKPVNLLAAKGNYFVAATSNEIKSSGGVDFSSESEITKIAVTETDNAEHLILFLTKENELYSLNNANETERLSSNVKSFALGNLKNETNNYVVAFSGNKIFAFSLQGGVADNFPFLNPFGNDFTGTPLVGDFNGDNKDDVLAVDSQGNVFLIDGASGKSISPFPISAGSQIKTAVLKKVSVNNSSKIELLAFTENATLFDWEIKFSDKAKIDWCSEFGSFANNSYLAAPTNGTSVTEFFPVEDTYNWPNPVYGNETRIHYFVKEDAKVEITIMDLSGEIVKKINANAKGGFVSETVWNVGNVQSGVYFAHVKVKSVTGKSAYKIIKIAVIH